MCTRDWLVGGVVGLSLLRPYLALVAKWGKWGGVGIGACRGVGGHVSRCSMALRMDTVVTVFLPLVGLFGGHLEAKK